MGDNKKMRIMGLDIGSHTIGVAISDELRITAQGLKTIRRTSKEGDFEEIRKIINQFQIGKIVVGLPKNMNGTLGKQAKMVLQWTRDLEQEIHLLSETPSHNRVAFIKPNGYGFATENLFANKLIDLTAQFLD